MKQTLLSADSSEFFCFIWGTQRYSWWCLGDHMMYRSWKAGRLCARQMPSPPLKAQRFKKTLYFKHKIATFVSLQLIINSFYGGDSFKNHPYCARFRLENCQGEIQIEELQKLGHQTGHQPACMAKGGCERQMGQRQGGSRHLGAGGSEPLKDKSLSPPSSQYSE